MPPLLGLEVFALDILGTEVGGEMGPLRFSGEKGSGVACTFGINAVASSDALGGESCVLVAGDVAEVGAGGVDAC